MSSNDENQADGGQTWRVPAIADCRAQRFGPGDDIVYCLVEDSKTCGFSLRFGSGFLCLHPKRGEIVERTALKSGAIGHLHS
jgi:hypothetical protein